jgi:hypothetical protein
VDRGNNAAPHVQPTDIAGNPRIASPAGSPDRIDIGAYEFINVPPVVDAGPDQSIALGAECLAVVTLNGSGFDPDGDPLTFVWTSSVGTWTGSAVTVSLPVGSYPFVLTASDGRGGTTSDSVLVTVLDVTPPSIGAVTATPNVLSPADQRLVPVVVSVSASDACGGALACRIVSVTSDEPQTGLWPGDIGPDWQITGDLSVELRAERSKKGDGRIYSIEVECVDTSGNTSRSIVTVVVPRR